MLPLQKGTGSIPGAGTNIPHAAQHSRKIGQKEKKERKKLGVKIGSCVYLLLSCRSSVYILKFLISYQIHGLQNVPLFLHAVLTFSFEPGYSVVLVKKELSFFFLQMELSGITNSKAFQKPGQSPDCEEALGFSPVTPLLRLKYASLRPPGAQMWAVGSLAPGLMLPASPCPVLHPCGPPSVSEGGLVSGPL